jgi:hypothetical protein
MAKAETLLLSSLSDFYNKNEKYKTLLREIVDGKHKLSLRVIDWLVTHYSKNNNIYYWIDTKNTTDEIYESFPSDKYNCENLKKIHLYLDYRAQLKSYTKFNFDSFRRHDRISFILDEEKQISIETTIGQLNFFRWAFTNKIIEYAKIHHDEIYANMTNNSYKKISVQKRNIILPKQDIINTKCYIRFD